MTSKSITQATRPLRYDDSLARPSRAAAQVSTTRLILSHEGLRGLAALMVALFHIPVHGRFATDLTNIPWIANAWIGVDLFFLLSGFVLFWSYSDRLHSKTELSQFGIRRFGRLYPLHLATLFAFSIAWLAVQCGKWLVLTIWDVQLGTVEPFGGPGVNGTDFLLSLTLLQGAGIRWTDAFNYPAWSVSVEILMYIVFATLIFATRQRRSLCIALFAALMACSMLWYLNIAKDSADFAIFFLDERSLMRGLLCFSAGVCAAGLRLALKNPPRHIALLQIVAGVVMLIFVAELHTLGTWLLLAPLVFGLLVFSMSYDTGWLSQVFMSQPLAWIGRHSYSIYMVHATVLLLFSTFGRYLPEFFQWWLVPIYIAVVLFVSMWTYRLIEQPWREAFRKIAERQTTA